MNRGRMPQTPICLAEFSKTLKLPEEIKVLRSSGPLDFLVLAIFSFHFLQQCSYRTEPESDPRACVFLYACVCAPSFCTQ